MMTNYLISLSFVVFFILVVFLVVLIGVFVLLLKAPLLCIHHDGLLSISLKSYELLLLMISLQVVSLSLIYQLVCL